MLLVSLQVSLKNILFFGLKAPSREKLNSRIFSVRFQCKRKYVCFLFCKFDKRKAKLVMRKSNLKAV